MKAQNRKFRKKIIAPLAFSIPISQVILTDPAIYSLLADFIIYFRLINWHYPFNDQESTRRFCTDNFMFVLERVLKKNKLPNEKIRKISSLSSRVLEKSLLDLQINFYWASAAVVDISRNINLRNFLNKKSIIYQIFNARTEFLYSYKRKLSSNQKYLFTEKHINDEEYLQLFEDHNIMIHLWATEIINNVLMFIIPLYFLSLIADVFNVESLSVRKENLYYLLPLALFLNLFFSFITDLVVKTKVEKYSFYYSRNMFKLTDLSDQFKNSLLQSIAESFRIDKESKAVTKVTKISETNKQQLGNDTIEEIYFEDKTQNNHLVENQKKVKKKTQAAFPDLIGKHCNDNEQNNYVDLILNSAKLSKIIDITWESKEYGTINFRWGHPETYKLWSNKKNLDQELKLCFVYFPTEKLLDENDKELVEAFKKVASLGHVVDHKAQGYVRTSEKAFKIKIFANKYKAFRMPVELAATKLIQSPIEYQQCRLFIAKNPIKKTTSNEKYLQSLYSNQK